MFVPLRRKHVKRFNETHKCYDALQYPLLFLHDSDGYRINILKTLHQDEWVSTVEFYWFHLMVRDDNYLLLFRHLLNVYIVHRYVGKQSEMLLYLHTGTFTSEKVTVEKYAHLRHDWSTICDFGKIVIFPPLNIDKKYNMWKW